LQRKGAGSTSEKPLDAKVLKAHDLFFQKIYFSFQILYLLVLKCRSEILFTASDIETFSSKQRSCKEKPFKEKGMCNIYFTGN